MTSTHPDSFLFSIDVTDCVTLHLCRCRCSTQTHG